ncbi:MAG: cell surface protein [Curvibacter sp.]|nr:MAG: cell surface protein [Curvibacter sp.]
MNKRILSLSIAAIIGGVGVAGGASAAVLAPAGNGATGLAQSTDGTGHILLVPYFTTQSGNATLLNIVNTDQKNGKAVKVRFRGASNSDDVFDFQVFLSPGDVWTANVSQGSDGRSVLTTSDKSCTRPAVVSGTSFPTGRLPSTYTDAQKANETREGYIEILNMADIPKGQTKDQYVVAGNAGAVGTNPLFTAIKHVSGVAPCTETVMATLATDPSGYSNSVPYLAGGTFDNGSGINGVNDTAVVSTSAQALGLTFPTGGLFADWTIINVPNTTTYSGSATALKADGVANLVFFPQTANPLTTTVTTNAAGSITNNGSTTTAATVNVAASINAASTVDVVTADPLLRTTLVGDYTGLKQVANTPLVAAAYYDQPDLSTPYTGAVGASTTAALTQALKLTGSIAVSSVSNEYLTNPLINASTDWVFSSPTRRYNTAFNYAYSASTGDGRVFTNYGTLGNTTYTSAAGGGTIALNTDYPFFSPLNTSVSGKQICVTSDTQNGFGQEEQTTTTGFVVSPGTPYVLSFCGETSIVVFGSSSVLGAAVASNKAPPLPATDGWLRIGTTGKAAIVTNGFNATTAALTAATTNYGLPVIGYSAEKAVNGAVSAGVSGNFGLLYGHRVNK